jgi:hypothetical protein
MSSSKTQSSSHAPSLPPPSGQLAVSETIETPRLYKDKAKLASFNQPSTIQLVALIASTASSRTAAAAAKVFDDASSMPAICYACRAGGEPSALKVLIANIRADEGVPNDDRKGLALAVDRNRGWKLMTPSMFASSVQEGAFCLTELIILGCDLGLRDLFDNTALLHAATSGSLTALKLLVEPVATLCSRSDGKTIPSAILTGLSTSASVNAANAVGRTALHIAANGGHLSCVQYLLSKGADINLADSRLRITALHLSAAAGNEKIVTCLIENGADITLLDSKGRTALQVCCSIKQCEEAFRTSVYHKAKTSSPLDVTV